MCVCAGRVANTPGVPREDDPAFVACCPNIHSMPPLPKLANTAIEEGLYQPKLFSEQAFVTQLRNAVLFLKRVRPPFALVLCNDKRC